MMSARGLGRGLLPIVVVLAAPAVGVVNAASMYRVATFGGDLAFQPRAINDAGLIAGERYSRAVVFDTTTGALRMLDTLGGSYSTVRGINDLGQVIGESTRAGDKISRAYLFDGQNVVDVGPPGSDNVRALDLNDRGEVLVRSERKPSPPPFHDWKDGPSYLYSEGQTRLVPSLGTAGPGNYPGFEPDFLANDGTMTSGASFGERLVTDRNDYRDLLIPMQDPHYWNAHAMLTDVNNNGAATGYSVVNGRNAAWIAENGQVRDLPALPGSSYVYVGALNDLGAAVGTSLPGTTRSDPLSYWPRATLFDEFGAHDLNDLLDLDSRRWFIQSAYDINDRGQILAFAADLLSDNKLSYVLLNPVDLPMPLPAYPVPEPTLLTLAALVGGLALLRRRLSGRCL